MKWTIFGAMFPFGVLSLLLGPGLFFAQTVGKGVVLGALMWLGVFFMSGLAGVPLAFVIKGRFYPWVRFGLGLLVSLFTPLLLSFAVHKTTPAGDFMSKPTGEWVYDFNSKQGKPSKKEISVLEEQIQHQSKAFFKVKPVVISMLDNEFDEKMTYREVTHEYALRGVRFFKKDSYSATLEWLLEVPGKPDKLNTYAIFLRSWNCDS